MSDIVDRARRVEEMQRNLAIAAARMGLRGREPAAELRGICIDCGGEIGGKRLEAMPSAQRCIDCQEDVENEERMGF